MTDSRAPLGGPQESASDGLSVPEVPRDRRSRLILVELVAMPFGITLWMFVMNWIFDHSSPSAPGSPDESSGISLVFGAVGTVMGIGLKYVYLTGIGVAAGLAVVVTLAIVFAFSRGWPRAPWVASGAVGAWLVAAVALGVALHAALVQPT